MRAVWIGVPEHFLEERRRLGQDKHDELWDGVLHMSPTPSFLHVLLANDLKDALTPIAHARGFKYLVADLGIYDHPKNYRVPDVSIVDIKFATKRGVKRAELVIEVLSPDDESRDKFPFYATRGVREIWLVAPETRELEVYRLVRKQYRRVSPVRGLTHSPLLEIEISCVAGKLRIVDGEYVAEV